MEMLLTEEVVLDVIEEYAEQSAVFQWRYRNLNPARLYWRIFFTCASMKSFASPTHATSHASTFESEESAFHNSIPLNGHAWYN
jgi:hypothetical protein